jgi:hypothetical protein
MAGGAFMMKEILKIIFMNWFEYLRGYEDGQRDSPPVSRHNNDGIMFSLVKLLINLIWMGIMVCFYLLKLLYKSLRKII